LVTFQPASAVAWVVVGLIMSSTLADETWSCHHCHISLEFQCQIQSTSMPAWTLPTCFRVHTLQSWLPASSW
jgi:hypothetical protein